MDEEETKTDDNSPRIFRIPRYYITHNPLSEAHIRGVLGNEATDEDVLEEMAVMKVLKRNLKEFARDRIQQLQFEEAKLRQGLDIQQWDDIGTFFQKDGSDEMCEKMFHIMYGYFKKVDGFARMTKSYDNLWARQIEIEFLKKEELEYNSENVVVPGRKRKPNGIEEMIMRELNEQNKLIQNRTKVTHRKRVNITSLNGKRPLPGVFYKEYITEWSEADVMKGKKTKINRKRKAEQGLNIMRWKAEEEKMHQKIKKNKKARADCRETFMNLSGNGKKKKKKEKRNTIKKSAGIKKKTKNTSKKKVSTAAAKRKTLPKVSRITLQF